MSRSRSASSDDSSSDDETCDAPSLAVELGFVRKLDPYDSYRLQSHFFPVGKVGGRPSWLAYESLPKVETDLACKNCSMPMRFLMQLSAPPQEALAHAFHRTLYVFICARGECCRSSDSSIVRIIRCQLPRENPFHPSDEPPNADEVGPAYEPAKTISDFGTHLCVVCGCRGDKKCSACSRARYCTRAHQLLHWRNSHKANCGANDANDDCDSLALFDEYALDLGGTEDTYRPPRTLPLMADRISDYNYEQENSCADTEEDNNNLQQLSEADETPEARIFRRFRQRLSRAPKQILRYSRHSTPLRAASPPSNQVIPPCKKCGAKRTFEFQITPYVLCLLGLDDVQGPSLDFTSLHVYTCSRDCDLAKEYYNCEYAVKEDV